MVKVFIPCAGLLMLLLATAATFSPSLTGTYVYDDLRFIEHNPFMEAPIDPVAPFIDPGTMESRPVRDIYRPLRTLVFRIEHALGNGRPQFHHLMGLVFHLINTMLVFLLAKRVRLVSPGSARSDAAALLGAGVFALHPLQTETVAWISSRGDQLVVLFLLSTLILVFNDGKREQG
ncbi:MAG: hypothetical protein ABIK28_12195, partial [Planctomycetota bacterium]